MEGFAKFVEDSKPQFILMMGDQLYLDEDGVDVFRTKLNAGPKARRNAIVEKYKINWSREVVRKVLANTPVYMMWDDHDIRDGWGSGASDSETLVARHPRGKRIFDKCDAYYQDCRDIYWHFQGATTHGRATASIPRSPTTSMVRPLRLRAMPCPLPSAAAAWSC